MSEQNGRAPRTVAVMSPGDMGHAVGGALRAGGLRVITCLTGRSERSRALAEQAGIEAVPDDDTLVREADVLLSILVPAEAHALAERLATALRRTHAELLYVDCNAIAPQTVRSIAGVVEAAGAHFVDAGIIGGPPRLDRPGSGPKVYASGAQAPELAQLRDHGLDVRVMGLEIGQASALKMCYAALTKGLTALGTELLVAGQSLGIAEALEHELRTSQAQLYAGFERSVPGMPPKAYRWVGEMEEIAATFGAVGLTPKILEGAADLYRFVERTPLGMETPEQRTRGTSLPEVVEILAAALTARTASGS